MYVCPDDYLKFAAAERGRWNPLLDGSGESREQAQVHEHAKDSVPDGGNHTAPAHPEGPTRTVDELMSGAEAPCFTATPILEMKTSTGSVTLASATSLSSA